MDRNPFAPPTAEVADVPIALDVEPPYFAVSLLKLTVLSVCTIGIYELFWFYRQWRCVKRREGNDSMPFWRAFFAVLFCYSLFKKIRDNEVELGMQDTFAAGSLAAGWILTTIAWKLPDPYWLVAYFAVLFLLPVQSHANRINAAVAPGHNSNCRFSAWNWVTVGLGGVAFALTVVGAFLQAGQHRV